MVIYEHVKGTIVIPIYNDNGDFADRTADINFTEDDIIKDSCTITARACDDNTFSLGGVRSAELSIKLRLDGEGINAYNLYGAKITLYSCYKQNPTASDWVFRGFYWVTSVSHVKNIYTLRASDVLVWLDSNSYEGGDENEKDDSGKTELDKRLVNVHRTLDKSVEEILDVINNVLSETENETITLHRLDESRKSPHDLVGIFRNNSPEFPQPISLAISMWGVLDENDGYFNSRFASDYIADIAELYAGFATEYSCLDFTPDNPQLQIIPFGYQNESAGYGTVYIKYSEIERDSLDIAGYKLYFQKTSVKTFDGTTWGMWSNPKKYGGNVIIDLTGNSFLDGRHHGMVRYDEDHNTNYQNQSEGNVFEIMETIGIHAGKLNVRPFKLKCHKAFYAWKEYPKLGMQIEIEDADGKVKKSIITKSIWKFRGGWELGCTGSDNRVLSQAAKKSLASHASGNVKMYANYVASELNKHTKFVEDNTKTANGNANGRLDVEIFDNFMQTVANAFGEAGVDFGFSYENGTTELPDYRK